jgi:hypothetical protein
MFPTLTVFTTAGAAALPLCNRAASSTTLKRCVMPGTISTPATKDSKPSEMVFDFLERFGLLAELATTVITNDRETPLTGNVARGISRLYDDLCTLHSNIDQWEQHRAADVGV